MVAVDLASGDQSCQIAAVPVDRKAPLCNEKEEVNMGITKP